MSQNENGLNVGNWTLYQHHSPISQGTIVGISFGWIIGVIGLYILGMCIIYHCIKSKQDDDSEESQYGRQESSGSNVKSGSKDSGFKVKKEIRPSSDGVELKQLRKKKLPEYNPTTLELLQDENKPQGLSIDLKFKEERQD